MTTQVESTISVTLNLPNGVYESFKRKAAQTHRSVEDELLVAVVQKSGKSDVLADEIPLEMIDKLGPMLKYSDKALWRAARSRLSATESSRLENLNYKCQKFGSLTPNEVQEQNTLIAKYEEAVLIRAKALYLLQQRGHDITTLLKIRSK